MWSVKRGAESVERRANFFSDLTRLQLSTLHAPRFTLYASDPTNMGSPHAAHANLCSPSPSVAKVNRRTLPA